MVGEKGTILFGCWFINIYHFASLCGLLASSIFLLGT